jgi:hypothetical protein
VGRPTMSLNKGLQLNTRILSTKSTDERRAQLSKTFTVSNAS